MWNITTHRYSKYLFENGRIELDIGIEYYAVKCVYIIDFLIYKFVNMFVAMILTAN